MKTSVIIVTIIVIVLIVGGYFYFSKEKCFGEGKIIPSEISVITDEICCGELSVISTASEEDYKEFYESRGLLRDGEILPMPGDPPGYFTPPQGFNYVCSDCGNNNCETWENRCNCPEDCE